MFNKVLKAGSILEQLGRQNIDMNEKVLLQWISILEWDLNEKKEEMIWILS